MLTPTTGPIALAILTALIVTVCYLRAGRAGTDAAEVPPTGFDTTTTTTTPTDVADVADVAGVPAGEDDTDTVIAA